MRISLPSLLVLGAALSSNAVLARQECITEVEIVPKGGNVKQPGTATFYRPAKTITLITPNENVSPSLPTAAVARAADEIRRVAAQKRAGKTIVKSVTVTVTATSNPTAAVTPTQVITVAPIRTVTARPIAATTTVLITSGSPGGTTTVTSYTLNVPAPSLASPALQRRRMQAREPAAFEEEHTVLEARSALTNGINDTLLSGTNQGPDGTRPAAGTKVYCSNVVTVLASAAATAAPKPQARLLLLPLPVSLPVPTLIQPPTTVTLTSTVVYNPGQYTTVTVTAPAVMSTAYAGGQGPTTTYTPTSKLTTVTSTIAYPAAATAVVGGYDVCRPSKSGPLYDWTAYEAQAVAFGLSTFANVTDASECCNAAASKPGALAWALCDGTSSGPTSCTKGVLGPCFVTYLKTIAGFTSATEQCVPDSVTSTFQYRKGSGQVGGPLQCASTYEAYTCAKPILGLLGNVVCKPA